MRSVLVIAFVTERSSSVGAPGSCSWANARATSTARSFARWPESHREQARGAFAEGSALANGDSCRRLLSPESSSLDAARRQTYARAQMRERAPRAVALMLAEFAAVTPGTIALSWPSRTLPWPP